MNKKLNSCYCQWEVMSTLKVSFRLPNPRLALWRHLSFPWEWKELKWLTVSVTKKEKDTTENLLWRKRKVTRLLRFLMLSAAGAILFSLVYSDAIPLGKNRKSQVKALSAQLFSLFTAVPGREQLTYGRLYVGGPWTCRHFWREL